MRTLFFVSAFAAVNAVTIQSEEQDQGVGSAVMHAMMDKTSQDCARHFLGAQKAQEELNAVLAELDRYMDYSETGDYEAYFEEWSPDDFELYAEVEEGDQWGWSSFKKMGSHLLNKAKSIAAKAMADPMKAFHCATHMFNSGKQMFNKLKDD